MDMYTKADFKVAFQDVQTDVYNVADAHGFHDDDGNTRYVPSALALIMSEASEALEAHRSRKMHEVAEELADVVIRCMDLAESLEMDLADAIIKKVERNISRPYRHGDKLY